MRISHIILESKTSGIDLTDPKTKREVYRIIDRIAATDMNDLDIDQDDIMDMLKEEYPNAWNKIFRQTVEQLDVDFTDEQVTEFQSISNSEFREVIEDQEPGFYDYFVDHLNDTRAWDKTTEYMLMIIQQEVERAGDSPEYFIKSGGLDSEYFGDLFNNFRETDDVDGWDYRTRLSFDEEQTPETLRKEVEYYIKNHPVYSKKQIDSIYKKAEKEWLELFSEEYGYEYGDVYDPSTDSYSRTAWNAHKRKSKQAQQSPKPDRLTTASVSRSGRSDDLQRRDWMEPGNGGDIAYDVDYDQEDQPEKLFDPYSRDSASDLVDPNAETEDDIIDRIDQERERLKKLAGIKGAKK